MKPASPQGIGVVVVCEDSPLSRAGIQTYDYITGGERNSLRRRLRHIQQPLVPASDNTVTSRCGEVEMTFEQNVTLSYQLLQNTSSDQTFKSPFIGVSFASPVRRARRTSRDSSRHLHGCCPHRALLLCLHPNAP